MNVRQAARVAAVLAVASSSALAQGRMGGMGGMGSMGGRGATPGAVTREAAIAIPKYVNPVNLLVEHRQALALSDTQFMRVIAIKRAVDSTNAPLARRLDSVQHLFKGGGPMFGGPSAERRDSLASARAVIGETIADVRENVAAARDKAYALLSSTQLTRALEFEDKAEKAAADENEQAGRGGGSGGRKGRPPTD